jgi:hypothetical protein
MIIIIIMIIIMMKIMNKKSNNDDNNNDIYMHISVLHNCIYVDIYIYIYICRHICTHIHIHVYMSSHVYILFLLCRSNLFLMVQQFSPPFYIDYFFISIITLKITKYKETQYFMNYCISLYFVILSVIIDIKR